MMRRDGILVTNSGHSKFGQVCSHLNPKDERCLKEWVKKVTVIRKRQFLQETLLINVYLQFQLKIVGKCVSVLFYCWWSQCLSICKISHCKQMYTICKQYFKINICKLIVQVTAVVLFDLYVKNFLLIIDSHLLCDVYDINATFI